MNLGSSVTLARAIRAHVLYMTHKANASHIGTCLSIADILAVLYSGILRVDPTQPDWPDRDRFISQVSLEEGLERTVAWFRGNVQEVEK